MVAARACSARRACAEQVRPPEWCPACRVGFDGCYKAGLWTPVEVILRGGSQSLRGRVSLTVPDGDGVASRVVTPPERARLASRPARRPRSRCTFASAAFAVGLTAEFRGRWPRRCGEDVSWRRPTRGRTVFPGRESRPLIVCLGGVGARRWKRRARWAGWSRSGGRSWRRSTTWTACPISGTATKASTPWCFPPRTPELCRQFAPGSPQLEALDQWVRMGGRLVLCAGDTPRRCWAKAPPWRVRPRTAAKAWCRCGRPAGWKSMPAAPSRSSGHGGESLLDVPRLTGVEGVVEAREADLPLVIRTGPRAWARSCFWPPTWTSRP